MKIKKNLLICLLVFIFSVSRISADNIFVNGPLITGFSAGQFLTLQEKWGYSETHGGFYVATNPCFDDFGAVIGLQQLDVFADYSFTTDFYKVFDSTIESGISASFIFCNAALVPVWNINSKDFDLDYRLGFKFGLYGFSSEKDPRGCEFDAYFQAPFDDLSKCKLVVGIKGLLLTKPLY